MFKTQKTSKTKFCNNRFTEKTLKILDENCKAYNMSRSNYLEMLIINAQTNNTQDIINQTQILQFQLHEYETQYTTKIEEAEKIRDKINKTKLKISKLNNPKIHQTSYMSMKELKIKQIVLKDI